jgi:hypothetical protein
MSDCKNGFEGTNNDNCGDTNNNDNKINYDELCEYYQEKNCSQKRSSNILVGNKKQIKRKENKEEHSFFLWNVLYIFFLPYVCRIKPVSDEDIPQPDSRDSSEISYNKTKDLWKSRYKKYVEDLECYEMEKSKNLKFGFFNNYFYIYFFIELH